MSRLALLGGTPVRTAPFPPYFTIGEEEKRAVNEVLDSKVLSAFLGTWSPQFYGGYRVKKLEAEWSDYFRVKHTVSVNSATSGLNAAVGATGVGPGDEVIVSPYTMSASAACVLVYNAVPVFADIDSDTFNITAETIEARLTPRTKAIVVPDIFGQPADMAPIMELAKQQNLIVIEDAAQAPNATYHGRYAGTLAHMGVFSLNCHKTIHCGEGGVVVTDDDHLAERLQLIRNHAEVVVKGKGVKDIVSMLGFNYRMTEIEAAIASEQLKKLDRLHRSRVAIADYLTEHLRLLPGLSVPKVLPGVVHGWYVYAFKYDDRATDVPRSKYVAALKAEGMPLAEGYVEPLYLQPLYQERQVYGRVQCPIACPHYKGTVSYDKGLCPTAERMYSREVFYFPAIHDSVAESDLGDLVAAFRKVSDQNAIKLSVSVWFARVFIWGGSSRGLLS